MDYIWERMDVVNGEPSEKILIIARKYRYAEAWCEIHGVNPRSRKIMFARSVRGLYGHHVAGSYYVDLGTGDQEFRELLERLKDLDAIRPLLTPNI